MRVSLLPVITCVALLIPGLPLFGEKEENGGYLVGHTNLTYLFGPDGEPLAMLPTDEGSAAVAAELEKWVR